MTSTALVSAGSGFPLSALTIPDRSARGARFWLVEDRAAVVVRGDLLERALEREVGEVFGHRRRHPDDALGILRRDEHRVDHVVLLEVAGRRHGVCQFGE